MVELRQHGYIGLIVLLALICGMAVCGNGCLWVGHFPDTANSSAGSSGSNQATSPNPSNGTANVPVNLTLSWGSVWGMSTFDVYLGATNQPSFVANVPYEPYRTSYTLHRPLEYDTTYYWRVDCKNTIGTFIGYLWMFHTAQEVLVVSNPNPADGAQNIPITATISWNPVTGAASYDVYFGLTPVFQPPFLPPFVGHTNTTSYDPGTLLYQCPYYWKIVVRDAGNAPIAYSNLWVFATQAVLSKASLPAPSDNMVNVDVRVPFTWASSVMASNYDVFVGTTNPPPWVANIPKIVGRTMYFSPGHLDYSTKYYWRANARDGAGGNIIGDIWSFTTEQAPPDQVGTPAPVDGAVDVPVTATLSWLPAARAEIYEIYFGTNVNPGYRTSNTNPWFQPGLLAYQTTYYWKVNTRNTTGRTFGSVIWSFTTGVQSLAVKPSGPYPANNASYSFVTAAPSWLSGGDAVSYDVYFDASTPPQFKANVRRGVYRTSYSPGLLAYNTTYYWRVDAVNSGGTTTGDIWQFKTLPPFPDFTAGASPASGAVGCPTTQVLTWAAANRADSYDVYFSTTSTIVLGDKKINTAGLAYTPTGLVYNTVYYWRIDSRNATGATTGAVWNFKTMSPPAQVVTITPADGAVDVPTTEDLSWNAAARAESYNVYFGITDTPQIPLAVNITQTSYAPALAPNTTYYWRIDAMNIAGTTAGQEQSFTTAP